MAPAPAPATASSIESLDDEVLALVLRLARSSSSWLQHQRTCLVCSRWRHVFMTHNRMHLSTHQPLQPLSGSSGSNVNDEGLPVWGSSAMRCLVQRYVRARAQVRC